MDSKEQNSLETSSHTTPVYESLSREELIILLKERDEQNKSNSNDDCKKRELINSLTSGDNVVRDQNQLLDNKGAESVPENSGDVPLSHQEDATNRIRQLQNELKQSTIMNTDCHFVISSLLDNIRSLQDSLDRREKKLSGCRAYSHNQEEAIQNLRSITARLVDTLKEGECSEEQSSLIHEFVIAFSESDDNSDMENILAYEDSSAVTTPIPLYPSSPRAASHSSAAAHLSAAAISPISPIAENPSSPNAVKPPVAINPSCPTPHLTPSPMQSKSFDFISFLQYVASALQVFPFDASSSSASDRGLSQECIKEGEKLCTQIIGHISAVYQGDFTVKPWLPDRLFPSCPNCGVAFSTLRRRHHCRRCGRVLCKSCCNHRITWEPVGKNQRVCDECFYIFCHLPKTIRASFVCYIHIIRCNEVMVYQNRLIKKYIIRHRIIVSAY